MAWRKGHRFLRRSWVDMARQVMEKCFQLTLRRNRWGLQPCAQRFGNSWPKLAGNASSLSEVTRANPLGREHKAGTASLSIESFELSRLRDGSTLVVWILNEVLVLGAQFQEAS